MTIYKQIFIYFNQGFIGLKLRESQLRKTRKIKRSNRLVSQQWITQFQPFKCIWHVQTVKSLYDEYKRSVEKKKTKRKRKREKGKGKGRNMIAIKVT